MKSLIELYFKSVAVIFVLSLLSGCDDEHRKNNGKECLFPPSSFWQIGEVEIREDFLVKEMSPFSPFYLRLIIFPSSFASKEIQKSNGEIYSIPDDGSYFFIVDSSLRCVYSYGRREFVLENGQHKDNIIRKKFAYTISLDDYTKLLDKIVDSKIMGYGEFCAEENPEHSPSVSLEIRSGGIGRDVWYGYSIPKEMCPLYDFIREELIFKYISKMDAISENKSYTINEPSTATP